MALPANAGDRPTSPFDRIKHGQGANEHWIAREMQPFLAYSEWRNMLKVAGKAMAACRNAGHRPEDHFVEITAMIEAGKGARRNVKDYRLSRYACYLIAMNGDPEKPEVAAAQTYFLTMARAQELHLAAAPLRPQVARAWSERLGETVQPHMLAMYQLHPDCFSVVTALSPQMLILEDELIRHMFEPGPGDRPDVSIGLCWAAHRRAIGLPETGRSAPLRLPGRKDPVGVGVYPNSERGACEHWFSAEYLPLKLPNYLKRKPEFKGHGELPPASVADITCRKLTGHPATLRPIVRRQLVAAGGFFPVGARIPQLPGSQPSLFD